MSDTTRLALPAASADRMTAPTTDDPVRLAYAGFLSRYKPRTRETYRLHLDQYLRWLAEAGIHPFDVRRPHLEIYLRFLEEGPLKSATRSSRFGVISLFYKFAVIDDFLTKNPCEHVARPKIHEGEQRRTWLPTLESLAVLRAASETGPREHLAIALMSIVAMRVGEVSSLNVGDVGTRGGWRTVSFIGKGGGSYVEVVPPQAVADLERLVAGRDPSEPLILNSAGRRLDRRSAATILRNACRAAGVSRDITPHGLRRAAATNMLAQHIPLPDVQRKLRHVDPRMTMRYDQGTYGLDRSAALPYASTLYGMLDAS